MESLINRVRAAMMCGVSMEELAAHFKDAGTPEDIYLAIQAAKLLDRWATENQ